MLVHRHMIARRQRGADNPHEFVLELEAIVLRRSGHWFRGLRGRLRAGRSDGQRDQKGTKNERSLNLPEPLTLDH
jgi:hypothetical protein